jgi:hypothetical protein
MSKIDDSGEMTPNSPSRSFGLGKTTDMSPSVSENRSTVSTCHDELLKLEGKTKFVVMFAIF